MNPITPACIACTGLLCATAIVISEPNPWASAVILGMTFLFYMHAAGTLKQQFDLALKTTNDRKTTHGSN